MSRAMPPVEPRRNYRCAAYGCPNAGCIDDQGEQRPGLCWQHYRESDPKRWGAVTAEIQRTWPELANHKQPLPAEQPVSEADMFRDEVSA